MYIIIYIILYMYVYVLVHVDGVKVHVGWDVHVHALRNSVQALVNIWDQLYSYMYM